MATQRGSDVLVGREDATYSGSFNIMGGMQNASLRFADPLVDYTHKGSSGLWRECIDGGGVRTVTIAGEGVVIEDAELDAMAASIFGTSARHQSLAFLMPGVGTVVGDFQVSDFSNTGRLNEAAQFSFTAESVGGTTFVPAVRDRYAMAASLVLDFVEGSYWVNGVHTTTFAAITGSSNTRASKAWYPGGWDFTNGGAITGSLVEFANNVIRVGAQGALIENSSTNQVRNARGENASAGTPGTLPTNWSVTAAGTTRSVVGSGTESGWPYVDIRFSGTPTASPTVSFEPISQISASNGESWTVSCGVKIVGGTTDNITSITPQAFLYSITPTYLENLASAATVLPTASHKRMFVSGTIANASTAYIAPALVVVWDGSGAIDITLRIYAPQCEQKAFPTSPILPVAASPAATTRAADEFQIANGAWSNDDGSGAFLCNFTPFGSIVAGSFGRIFSYGSDANNRVALVLNSSGQVRVSGLDGGVLNFDIAGPTWTTGVNYSSAISIATNDIYVSTNGTTGSDSAATIAYGNSILRIASDLGGANAVLNPFYLERLYYVPNSVARDNINQMGSAE